MNNRKVIIESSDNGYIARIENDPFSCKFGAYRNIQDLRADFESRMLEYRTLCIYKLNKLPLSLRGRLKINFVLREYLPPMLPSVEADQNKKTPYFKPTNECSFEQIVNMENPILGKEVKEPSRQYTERPFGSMMLFFNTEIVDFGVCKQSILRPGMRDDAGFIVTCTFMGDNSFYGFIADKSYKYYAEAQDVADKMKFGELPPPRFVRITNNGIVFLRHCMAEQDETMPAIPVADRNLSDEEFRKQYYCEWEPHTIATSQPNK